MNIKQNPTVIQIQFDTFYTNEETVGVSCDGNAIQSEIERDPVNDGERLCKVNILTHPI